VTSNPSKAVLNAPKNYTGKSVQVNRQRRSRRRNAGNSVGEYFGDAWSLAKRTAYGLNEIRKLINVESKVIDTYQTNTDFTSDGVIVPISRIAQGGDYNNRIGDSIRLQNIEVRIRLFKKVSSDTQTVCRAILFRDLDNMGTVPTVASLIKYDTQVSAPLSTFEYLSKERYSILADELLSFDTNNTTAILHWKMEHPGHILYYTGNANEAADGKGSLYLCFISDETTDAPNFAFVSRVTFTDN